jgi:(p)ppGpp synthase/HD superfamily hydrolase
MGAGMAACQEDIRMFLEPADQRYRDLVAHLAERHAGKTDLNGRPWQEHYRRVAIRVAMLNPRASRDQMEAALFHDALFTGGGGYAFMERMGLSAEAIRIVSASTPPADKDYFRDLRDMTPEQNALYQKYICALVATSDIPTIEFKLADIFDTLDQLTFCRDRGLKQQIHDQYLPARKMLEEGLRLLLDE